MSQAQYRPGHVFPTENVKPDDLGLAMKQIRRSNLTLISRSLRTPLTCFDDLDMHNFEPTSDYLVNFISNGINKCSNHPLQPVSILWPDNFDELVDQLAILDAYLLNNEFRERPVDWMIKHGLTYVPECRQCRDKLKVHYADNSVTWQCQKFPACSKYSMPVLRPTIFSGYEHVGLDKLLFCLYYWATCTPAEELYTRMNIEPMILVSLWRKLQNVCRTTLEKTYPRHRLTNVLSQGMEAEAEPEPIDLISLKLNDLFVVCAKHPRSNLVRLGYYIPKVSAYTFADLTESWFAHGTTIRVSETKFLDLRQKRADLNIVVATRIEMISKDDQFNRESAFGYLVSQLAHVLKDCDSSTLSREHLKLALAETQWRELYGINPFDAFTNMVRHISLYGDVSDWYVEPTEIDDVEQSLACLSSENAYSDYVWAEEYFYATMETITLPKGRNSIVERHPKPDARISCHLCNNMFETFEFSLHIIVHVEENRKHYGRAIPDEVECKHCFKPFGYNDIAIHSSIFRSYYHHIRYGCRICCVKLDNRSSYLKHMRTQHFEHECPYRCPCCEYASSFQRDIFVHFQEEHRYSIVVLCPLCLKKFTTSQPETMTRENMFDLSRSIYNHLAEHYILSRKFTCTNCSLCFVKEKKLLKHKRRHHNPLETYPIEKAVTIPFKVDKQCREYCVKALPMELFIANKRPNSHIKYPDNSGKRVEESNPSESNSTSVINLAEVATIIDEGDRSDESFNAPIDGNTIVVRGIDEASRFLAGGNPALSISKTPLHVVATSKKAAKAGGPQGGTIIRPAFYKKDELTSQKLIGFLSKLQRADGILPNQSVILTPLGLPAKCVECRNLITIDHYVAEIFCSHCEYVTFCPRAATIHNENKHQGKTTKGENKPADGESEAGK